MKDILILAYPLDEESYENIEGCPYPFQTGRMWCIHHPDLYAWVFIVLKAPYRRYLVGIEDWNNDSNFGGKFDKMLQAREWGFDYLEKFDIAETKREQ